MIVRHKRTGELYKVLLESFSMERQRISMVYCQLSTGFVFDRDKNEFLMNFEVEEITPQNNIEPKEPHS